jgi:repressor LexA
MPGPRGQTRQAVYGFLQQCLQAGRHPSLREIQAALGFKAVQTVKLHLDRLVSEGLLIHEPGKARSYRLARPFAPAGEPVPIWGRVRAGPLAEAIADQDGSVLVDSDLVRRYGADTLFALHVRGDSMVNAGIFEGDLVIARSQPRAEAGDIVVAMLDGEATVKRLAYEQGKPVLRAENPAYAPILVLPSVQFAILGKVVELRRRMEA